MLGRLRYLPLIIGLLGISATGCRPKGTEPLGEAASFVLLEKDGEAVKRNRKLEGSARAVTAALTDGFAAELMRTVFVLQQYLANSPGVSDEGLAWARDAVPVVLGVEGAVEPQKGFRLKGNWFGGPVERPHTVWVGVPGAFEDDRAVVPALAARLGRLLGEAAATAGRFDGAGQLAKGYQMALEVIAREWRTTPGARGAAPPKNDEAATLFAGVRENRFVLAELQQTRRAAELLADPMVAATVLYRISQDKALSKKVASDAFYTPLMNDRVPPGISPAAVLGAFRNLQMKLLGAWTTASLKGKPPENIADLVWLYGETFPEEREAVYRIFLTTTYGGTVVPEGVMATASGPEEAVGALNNLLADVIAGKKTLTSALNPASP